MSKKITYEEISAILLAIYSSVRGYSVKSTKQFCQKKKISPTIFQEHVQTMISEAVAEVKKNYYKMTDSCFSSPSTLERSSSSVSIIDLKFPAPLGKLDPLKSCVMNTVSGTSYKKKVNLSGILEQNLVKVCS